YSNLYVEGVAAFLCDQGLRRASKSTSIDGVICDMIGKLAPRVACAETLNSSICSHAKCPTKKHPTCSRPQGRPAPCGPHHPHRFRRLWLSWTRQDRPNGAYFQARLDIGGRQGHGHVLS